MISCSKYLSTLNSNTIYCGTSIPASSKDVSKWLAALGSPANPAKTIEQVLDLLKTAYANTPTVEIIFSAGTYGNPLSEYTWPANASVLRGGGSPVTILRGSHRFTPSANLQLVGLFFQSQLMDIPVLSFVQDVPDVTWNVLQQDTVIESSTNVNVPLIQRSVVTGTLVTLWSIGSWQQLGTGNGLGLFVTDSTCLMEVTIQNVTGDVGDGGGVAVKIEKPNGGTITVKTLDYRVVGGYSVDNASSGNVTITSTTSTFIAPRPAIGVTPSSTTSEPVAVIKIKSTGTGKTCFTATDSNFITHGEGGVLDAVTENDGDMAYSFDKSSLLSEKGFLVRNRHGSSGNFSSQISSTTLENGKMTEQTLFDSVHTGAGALSIRQSSISQKYIVSEGIVASSTQNMGTGTVSIEVLGDIINVLGGGDAFSSMNKGTGTFVCNVQNQTGSTEKKGMFSKAVNEKEGNFTIAKIDSKVVTEEGAIWCHSNRGKGSMETSVTRAVGGNTRPMKVPPLEFISQGGGNLLVRGESNKWTFETEEGTYIASHIAREGGNLYNNSTGSTSTNTGRGNMDCYRVMDETSSMNSNIFGLTATTQIGALLERENFGSFISTIHSSSFQNMDIATKPLITALNDSTALQMTLAGQNCSFQLQAEKDCTAVTHVVHGGTLNIQCNTSSLVVGGGANGVSYTSSGSAQINRSIQAAQATLTDGGGFLSVEGTEQSSNSVQESNCSTVTDTGYVKKSLISDNCNCAVSEISNVYANVGLATEPLYHVDTSGEAQFNRKTVGNTAKFVMGKDLGCVNLFSTKQKSNLVVNEASLTTEVINPEGGTEGQHLNDFQMEEDSTATILNENCQFSCPMISATKIKASANSTASFGTTGVSVEVGGTVMTIESNELSSVTAQVDTATGNCSQAVAASGNSAYPVVAIVNNCNLTQTLSPLLSLPAFVKMDFNFFLQLASSFLTGHADTPSPTVQTCFGLVDCNNCTLTHSSSMAPLASTDATGVNMTNSTCSAPNHCIFEAMNEANLNISTVNFSASEAMPCIELKAGAKAVVANSSVSGGMVFCGDGENGTTKANISNTSSFTAMKYAEKLGELSLAENLQVQGNPDCQPFRTTLTAPTA